MKKTYLFFKLNLAGRQKMILPNHAFNTILLCLSLSLFNEKTRAQQLELSSASLAASNTGPVTSIPTANFLANTGTSSTFSAYSPATTVTFSFTNQQYTSASVAGLVFGASQLTNGTPGAALTQQADLVVMNSLGAPQSGQYTSDPFGTGGTGIDVTANYAANVMVNAYYQQQPAIASYTSRPYYGDLVITFNRPVINPVLHFVGMGFSYQVNNATEHFQHGGYTEYELTSTEITAGYSFTRLSGSTNFGVTTSTIVNTNTTVNTDPTNISYYSSQSNTGAGGSVRVNTGGVSITQVALKVFLRGMSSVGSATTAGWYTQNTFGGDNTLVGVSVDLNNIAGNVFNDVNALTDNTVNGTGTNAGGLFANLVDGNGNIFATTSVSSGGTYSFSNVVAASNYQLVLTTANSNTSPKLPTGWINTGENIGTAAGSDGNPNGILAVGGFTSDVSNANFGIRNCAASPAIVVSASASPLVYCAGGTPINLTSSASGGGGTFSYLWTGSGVANTAAQNTTATPAVSGTYKVVAKDQYGCKDSINTNSVTYSNPTPSITTQCVSGTSFRLIETNGTTWLWTTSSGGRFYKDNTYSVATDSATSHLSGPYIKAAGTYSVQITDQYGCAGTGSINVDPSNCNTVLASGNITLSVSIVAGKALLQWKIPADEHASYSIERRQDDQQYHNIAEITGGTLNYSDDINNVWANKLYYRIKAVNATGMISYSNVALVNNNAVNKEVAVYPNPVIKGNTAIVSYRAVGTVQLIVTNISGVEVIKKTVSAGNATGLQTTLVNTSNLAGGMYFITIKGQDWQSKPNKLLVQ